MSDLNAYQYKGHSIEPLIYARSLPRNGSGRVHQRYQAAVTIVNLETAVKSTTRLPDDFDSFGDARRAAQTCGQALVDDSRKVPVTAA
ncbi:MAG TPA: hypothetical protein VGN52_11025 [Burkholderiales bacterium]|jgi:hypothetical protein